MPKREGRTPSQRQLRVGEVLRHALAGILERGELRDPGLAGTPLTVTEVRITPDLRNASVFVAPLGGEATEAILAPLTRATPFLRARLGRAVRLKYVPNLSFLADTSFATAQHVDALLDRARVKRGPDGEAGGDGT